jgi:2'-5' RNA ligase
MVEKEQEAPEATEAKPKSFRAFFAAVIPQEIRQQIIEILRPLQRDAKFRQVRWTAPENLHITLRFLGNITQSQYEEIVSKVSSILESANEFEVELASLLYFPSKAKPRVLILQPSSIARLAELAILIDKVVVECGVKPENRSFAPHLTIGRLNNWWRKPPELTVTELPKMIFKVNEVILFRSDPGEKKSVYTALKAIKLHVI